MAYDPTGLQLIVAGMSGTGGNNIWVLNTTDTVADANTSNYISDGVTLGMNEGDIVYVKTRASLPDGAVSAVTLAFVIDTGTGSDALGVDLSDGTAIDETDTD